jgi:Zn-dependent M16 (insulinase) family peptidase
VIVPPTPLAATPANLGPRRHTALALATTDTAFLKTSSPAIADHRHPDLAALRLAIKYLGQKGGPLHQAVRGGGLAYSAWLSTSLSRGQAFLSLHSAARPAEAYRAAALVLGRHAGNTMAWDKVLLESARALLVFDIIKKEGSLTGVVSESRSAALKGLGRTYNREVLAAVDRVTEPNLARVTALYLAPLVRPERCRLSLVCSPARMEEFNKAFGDMGIQLELLDSVDDIVINSREIRS